jgi:hypothetical protein
MYMVEFTLNCPNMLLRGSQTQMFINQPLYFHIYSTCFGLNILSHLAAVTNIHTGKLCNSHIIKKMYKSTYTCLCSMKQAEYNQVKTCSCSLETKSLFYLWFCLTALQYLNVCPTTQWDVPY